MLDIYQRYAHVLPPQFGVHAEDEPCLEEDAEDAGQRATVSALTAEIEQLEFERDAVLDMLGRYERARPLEDCLFEELDEAQLEVPPPISPKTREEFQQKIGTLSAQVCSLQSKLKEYERLLQPSQLATKHEAVGTPRTARRAAPGLAARAIRKLALLLQSAFQACTLLLWTASVALGIDRALLVVLVGLGGVLQLAFCI
ncbi:hypothetical protein QBZ16_002557 [Prototheca wickerhamii]|uniref:Uncharacterized protein n=1 Tax=Prototheca wickerhamii TaxID=3111 RepID=A0AAD9IMR4_PROWI|nr:hypothetical protein QBZ16_002557 [Prototheca wickerhamii]